MRIWSGAVILALGLGVACANKADPPNTPPAAGGAPAGGGAQAGAPAGGRGGGGAAPAPAGAPAPAPAPAGGRGGAGAQAAASVTPAQLETAMKEIGTLNPSLQKNLKSNALPEAAKDAQRLAVLFGDVERFWAQNKKPDAVMLSQTARMGATEAAGAATAGDQMKALMAAVNMGGTCKQCHGLYREGAAPGPYSIKAGVLTP